MLLLLLGLFSNYNLLQCYQAGQASFNETLLSAQMHKSIREIDSLLRDFQLRIQKEKSQLRTANLDEDLKDDQSLSSPTTAVTPSSNTQNNRIIFRPGYPQPYSLPPKEMHTPKNLSLQPLLSLLRGPFGSKPKLTTYFNFFLTRSTARNLKIVKNRTQYRQLITKRKQMIPTTTHRSRPLGRTLSKAQAWVRDRKWTKTSKGFRIKEILRITRPPHMIPNLTQVTQTAFTEELFKEDEDGFLFVTQPEVVTELGTGPMTSLGDVLWHALNFTTQAPTEDPIDEYHAKMLKLDEGYMMVFLLQLTKLIAFKNGKQVNDVLTHAETVVNSVGDQLAWFGEDIVKMIDQLSMIITEGGAYDMDSLKTQANMLYDMLEQRNIALSVEMNSIIDYAEALYEDDEGEALFRSLKEFEQYPNPASVKTTKEICYDLILNFLRPYRRLQNTDRLQRLLDTIVKVKIERFGVRRSYDEFLTLRGEETTKSNKSTRRRISNRSRAPETNDDHRRQINKARYPMLRKLLPITRHQTRFRVMTPRQLRTNAYLNIERPTKDYFFRGPRFTTTNLPYRGLQFFPQAPRISGNKSGTQTNTVGKLTADYVDVRVQQFYNGKHQLKLSPFQKKRGNMKAELIRRIGQDSSYSDEEATLVNNLDAALRGNRSSATLLVTTE